MFGCLGLAGGCRATLETTRAKSGLGVWERSYFWKNLYPHKITQTYNPFKKKKKFEITNIKVVVDVALPAPEKVRRITSSLGSGNSKYMAWSHTLLGKELNTIDTDRQDQDVMEILLFQSPGKRGSRLCRGPGIALLGAVPKGPGGVVCPERKRSKKQPSGSGNLKL